MKILSISSTDIVATDQSNRVYSEETEGEFCTMGTTAECAKIQHTGSVRPVLQYGSGRVRTQTQNDTRPNPVLTCPDPVAQ